ncbi:MAG TPA: hypothetical protein VLZ89_12995 [Anaerolineales bacterium]|nr:hypothetical protein [Anaerolineales bacterium]
MFNDRDLYILGGGGFLALLTLVPSWPFWLKVTLALAIMALALIVALIRVGPDRRTLEQQLYYFLKYRTQPRNYSFWGRGPLRPARGDGSGVGETSAAPTLSLAWDDLNIYFLMTVWLAVIGIYFTVWLNGHGDLQIAKILQKISDGR